MMPRLIIMLLLLTEMTIMPQTPFGNSPLAHTYSIVARDKKTGEMGVAVQSHWFSVGTIVAWGEAGVGVIATQSFVNPAYGPDGLALLKQGKSSPEALRELIAGDEGRIFRQAAVLDMNGNVSAYTGENCIPFAGHIEGDNFSVQANLMASDAVWPAMAEAFENSEKMPLAERLLMALEAAQNAGGDIRGKQSAALLIVSPVSTGQVWKDRLIDLRIDDNPEPLKELRRLLKVHRAYDHMNAGDLAVELGDMEKAMEEYSAAESMFPENEEMKYWHAVTLANNGKIDEAFPLFKQVFDVNQDWAALTSRLIQPGILTVSEKDLKRILALSH